jgi:hypothetical protein
MREFNSHSNLVQRTPYILLAGTLVLATPGCAKIKSQTREDFVSAGVEKEELEPRYETQVTTRLSGDGDFETAKLIVEARDLKTCRTQVVKLREKVAYTTNEFENSAVVWSNAIIGGFSLGCAATQFGDTPCISESENEETGETEQLTDSSRQAWGIGLGALGALATTVVFADLIRATDTSEVVATERQTLSTEEESCGAEPKQAVTVKVHHPTQDRAPYTTQTGSDGTVAIPLMALALANVDTGTSVGRVVVGEHELEADPFPSRWATSKKDHYARKMFGEAKASGSARAYFEYLEAFPEGTNARQAHLDLQAIVMKQDVPDVLQVYLDTFDDHPLVRNRKAKLTDRLRSLVVERAYKTYVSEWELDASANIPQIDDEFAAKELDKRLYNYHQEQLAQAKENGGGFDILRANYQASVPVAPSKDKIETSRDALASLLMEQATALREQDAVEATKVLALYEDAADWSGSSNVEDKARSEAVTFALAAFDDNLPDKVVSDDTAVKLELMLRQADKHARTDADKKRVQKARDTYADHSAKGILAHATQLATDSQTPADPSVIDAYNRAIGTAASDKVSANIRRSYLKYLAESLRDQARQIAEDDFSSSAKLDKDLIRVGLMTAQTPREKDILRVAWVDACADLAAKASKRDKLSDLVQWHSLMEAAELHADSAAAKKQLKHRRRQIERDLHKRYPPSKLESLNQAIVIYMPTIDVKDTSATRKALASPKSHRGERLVLMLDVQRSVGGKYLAETRSGQQVFIYSSNQYAQSRLSTGRRVGVLATIDGAIPYRKGGKRIYLPRLDVIWAER